MNRDEVNLLLSAPVRSSQVRKGRSGASGLPLLAAIRDGSQALRGCGRVRIYWPSIRKDISRGWFLIASRQPKFGVWRRGGVEPHSLTCL
jgi:hypothetical protein